MERRSRDTGSRPGECGRQLHRLQVELAVDNTGNSSFAKSFGHCRGLFVGPSALNNFAECLTWHSNTHGIVTFAEGRAVGRLGPSVESSLC
jgi:hypothetical protein